MGWLVSKVFPKGQLYIVFITADGGQDLEKFELRDFAEAQSVLLQTTGGPSDRIPNKPRPLDRFPSSQAEGLSVLAEAQSVLLGQH
eukprot:1186238-Prorocentrum_minimum.AAC.2